MTDRRPLTKRQVLDTISEQRRYLQEVRQAVVINDYEGAADFARGLDHGGMMVEAAVYDWIQGRDDD